MKMCAFPANLTEEDLIAIGKDNLPQILGVPEEYRNETISMLKKIVKHDAYENEHYKWSINDFELANRSGRGQFGRVYLAREKKTGFVVALKTIIKKEVKEDSLARQILREIEIQTHLQHPNILQLYTWFHDERRIYLVLEYAGHGELFKHLKNAPHSRFDEHKSAKYTYQVADALHYCHLYKVIHRDINPENVMLTFDDNIKLADFGLSVHAPSSYRKTMCGTLDYVPPEIIENKQYTSDVDNWSLGILCYEFLVGHPPFQSQNSEETYRKICSIEMRFPKHVSNGARDLITKLMRKEGSARISLPEVMSHYWIAENK